MIRTFNHFSLRELFASCTAQEIKDCIFFGYIDSLHFLLTILDCFREQCDISIRITSSYRDLMHNSRVGGSSTSQHLVGTALDFTSLSVANFEPLALLFEKYLKDNYSSDYVGQVIINHQKKYIHLALLSSKYKSFTINHIH